ncbi:UNVERIFIED_CONTAM: hypothetical protein FKN15_047314 [Acipenser sinensis]
MTYLGVTVEYCQKGRDCQKKGLQYYVVNNYRYCTIAEDPLQLHYCTCGRQASAGLVKDKKKRIKGSCHLPERPEKEEPLPSPVPKGEEPLSSPAANPDGPASLLPAPPLSIVKALTLPEYPTPLQALPLPEGPAPLAALPLPECPALPLSECPAPPPEGPTPLPAL